MSSATEGRPLDWLERVSLWTSAFCLVGMTLLMLAEWPKVTAPRGAASAEMDWVIDLIKDVRSVRAEMNVPAGAKVPLVLCLMRQ